MPQPDFAPPSSPVLASGERHSRERIARPTRRSTRARRTRRWALERVGRSARPTRALRPRPAAPRAARARARPALLGRRRDPPRDADDDRARPGDLPLHRLGRPARATSTTATCATSTARSFTSSTGDARARRSRRASLPRARHVATGLVRDRRRVLLPGIVDEARARAGSSARLGARRVGRPLGAVRALPLLEPGAARELLRLVPPAEHRAPDRAAQRGRRAAASRRIVVDRGALDDHVVRQAELRRLHRDAARGPALRSRASRLSRRARARELRRRRRCSARSIPLALPAALRRHPRLPADHAPRRARRSTGSSGRAARRRSSATRAARRRRRWASRSSALLSALVALRDAAAAHARPRARAARGLVVARSPSTRASATTSIRSPRRRTWAFMVIVAMLWERFRGAPRRRPLGRFVALGVAVAYALDDRVDDADEPAHAERVDPRRRRDARATERAGVLRHLQDPRLLPVGAPPGRALPRATRLPENARVQVYGMDPYILFLAQRRVGDAVHLRVRPQRRRRARRRLVEPADLARERAHPGVARRARARHARAPEGGAARGVRLHRPLAAHHVPGRVGGLRALLHRERALGRAALPRGESFGEVHVWLRDDMPVPAVWGIPE